MEKKYPPHIVVKKIPPGVSGKKPKYKYFKNRGLFEKKLLSVKDLLPKTFSAKIK